jgi:hypothetical protein
MKNFILILFGLVGAAVVIAVIAGTGMVPNQDTEEGIRQVGYFESGEKDRMVTAEFPPAETEQSVRKHADSLEHTQGRRTLAYYFYSGLKVPSHQMSGAASLDEANSTLRKAPGIEHWRYAYLKAEDGSGTFVDCRKQEASELCRRQAQNPPVAVD